MTAFQRIFTSILITLTLTGSSSSQEVLDRIVALVDDNIILSSELQQLAYSLALQAKIDPLKETEKFNKILETTMDEFIIQKVLLVQAKLDSITVDERQIDSVLEEQIQQMVQQVGSEKRLEEYFGSSLRQIRREFRDEVEERLLVQNLRDTKNREIKISRREIERFYSTFEDSLPTLKQAVNLRHILVNIEPSDEAVSSARKKAEEVMVRLQAGENFDGLAKQFSDDPGSASKGGNLGMVERGSFVKEFEEAAFNLEKDEISEIVRSKFGFHIIQLLEKKGEKINTRHILLKIDSSTDDELATKNRLVALKEKLAANDLTFEDAAKQYSKDVQTAKNGGSIGWFEIDQFQIEAFADAVKGLVAGELSEPVKTQFGYHLIKVEERREERKLNINNDWEQIEGWALDLKRKKEFEKYIVDIRKNVYIEIKDQ